jgi:hypothetical protein
MPKARKETTPVMVDSPGYTGRAVEFGDLTVVFDTIHQEQDTASVFKGLPGDRCPCPHWGVVVSGCFTARYGDHDETFEAGDIFYIPPGHLPGGIPGTELVTFSPTSELREVNAVLARNLSERPVSEEAPI